MNDVVNKPLPDRVAETVARHAMFVPGQTAGVAVSGGADSVCLLHALFELAPRLGIRLAVAHLNHRLRGAESDSDAAFVRRLAEGLGLAFHYRVADVAAAAGNLEQAGRAARLSFFRDLIRAGAADRIATGHTANDQAETVLFRFLRGSGTAGLSGILPVTGDGIVRPLLDLERADVEHWLCERGIPWREDSSNRDPSFARNRIRHDLLPALARDWNPGLVRTLGATASIARDEEDYWRGKVDDLFQALATRESDGILLPVRWVAELPRAAARRLIRKVFETVRGGLLGITLDHVEQTLALFSLGEGHGRLQAPGLDIFRSFDWVRLAPPAAATPRNWSIDVFPPGRYRVPRSNMLINLHLVNSETAGEAKGYNEEVSELDWERASGRLGLRNWRPGDEYQPRGESGPKKVKLLFQEHRVPLWKRRDWPMITSNGRIVWTRLFGPAEGFAAGPSTRAVLRIGMDFREPQESGDAVSASDR